MNLANYSAAHFDRGAPKWREALWWLIRRVFFQTAWPWPSKLRVSLLRLFGAVIGENVVIRENVNVSFPWRLRVGDHVWLGEEVLILSLAQVTIESNVCISQRTFLCTGSHSYCADKFDLVTKPIILRSGSWIAAAAFIGPGVEVGSGSVVSAASVAIHNVPAGCLVRGNPATVVKQLA